MKLALVTSSEGGIDFLPELKSALEKEIADIVVQTHYVSKNIDRPGKLASLQGMELIFVWIPIEEETPEKRMITEKIIELEMEKGLKIIKVFESGEEDLTEIQSSEIKQQKTTQFKEQIMNHLFNPESFKPGFKKQQ